MSGPAKTSPGGQVLVSKAGFCFYFFQKLHLSIFINKFISFIKPSVLLNKFINLFIKSSVLLNKFTKTSPYRKTTFLILVFLDFMSFIFLFSNFMILHLNQWFLNKIVSFGPLWAHKGPYGPQPDMIMGRFVWGISLKVIKLLIKDIKGVKSEKVKVKTWFCDKDLSS